MTNYPVGLIEARDDLGLHDLDGFTLPAGSTTSPEQLVFRIRVTGPLPEINDVAVVYEADGKLYDWESGQSLRLHPATDAAQGL